MTSTVVWVGPTSGGDAATGYGRPSPDAPADDQPADAAGPLGFRSQPCGRDLLSAPGGATALSHNDDGHAAFAGTGPGSASTTSRFRGSITHPVHPLSTLRTPRYRDARKTRSRPACSALAGPDFHRQATTSFAQRTPHPALRPASPQGPRSTAKLGWWLATTPWHVSNLRLAAELPRKPSDLVWCL